jgi:hypothetical protein
MLGSYFGVLGVLIDALNVNGEVKGFVLQIALVENGFDSTQFT